MYKWCNLTFIPRHKIHDLLLSIYSLQFFVNWRQHVFDLKDSDQLTPVNILRSFSKILYYQNKVFSGYREYLNVILRNKIMLSVTWICKYDSLDYIIFIRWSFLDTRYWRKVKMEATGRKHSHRHKIYVHQFENMWKSSYYW